MGPICPMSDPHEHGWRQVLPSAELATGKLAKVFVEGKPVLLARLDDGAVAAASAVCPHRGEDLSKGMIYFGGIDCSWHHYVYDLRTGLNRYPREAQRCRDRFHDIFNQAVAADPATEPGVIRVQVPVAMQLGPYYRELQAWSKSPELLEVWVRGRPVALDINRDPASDAYERLFA